AQRIEFLFRPFRVECHDLAVVLVAQLARDIDVVVERNGIVGESVLGHDGDQLPVYALGDGQAQRRVRENRTRRTVEGEVVPGVCGRTTNRDALDAFHNRHFVERGRPGGVYRVVL